MCSQQVKPISGKTAIFRPVSYLDRLDLRQLFAQRTTERPLTPPAQPMGEREQHEILTEVELGTGDGSFLANWAALHPERNFLGAERLLGRLRKADRKIARRGLDNVRLIRLEAAYFVEYLLPVRAVVAFHIYFPDPWPKRKQRKNRLINPRFVQAVAAALAPTGVVYLRTDDRDYFDEMRSVFGGSSLFQEVETPLDLQGVLTDFERGFQAKGVQTLRAAFLRLE